MNEFKFFMLQLIAHILADFIFQTKMMADDKTQKEFRSRYFLFHILLVFLFSWLCSFRIDFIWAALIISITHYGIDGIKLFLLKTDVFKKSAFFIDQACHLGIIFAVASWYVRFGDINFQWIFEFTDKQIAIILGYLFCLKPANVFIKEVFRVNSIIIEGETIDLPNAGKLIGILERILVLTFILLHQYESVGFLIAAKSILRYREDDTIKTEYVLIGTMLSVGIALVAGIVINTLG